MSRNFCQETGVNSRPLILAPSCYLRFDGQLSKMTIAI